MKIDDGETIIAVIDHNKQLFAFTSNGRVFALYWDYKENCFTITPVKLKNSTTEQPPL